MSDRQRTVTATGDDELLVSQAVLEMVADAEACDTTDLEPLYRSIDPEALDSLLELRPGEESGPLGVAFQYSGYHITAERGDDATVTITVSETAEAE